MNEKNFLVKIISRLLTVVERICIAFGFVIIRNMPCLSRKRLIDISFRAWDYNRYSSLELCAYEIIKNEVDGNVAELGVYQGVFAAKINELFNNKKLYLFDTFEGFSTTDKKIERSQHLKTKGIDIDFSNTSIEYVLKKMKYKECCIIKKGYFPDTTVGIEDTFCFVSIDVDLYKPIYEGLKYFYPRLNKGGYIFIHDFNNLMFPGTREAVQKFCSENQVSYFPLSDVGGSVVLTK